MLINNKIKKFLGGNWGKPNKVEQDIALSPFFMVVDEDNPVPYRKAKRRRIKTEHRYPGFLCPFCQTELPIDEQEKTQERAFVFNPRKKECSNCKSYEVTFCPACQKKTWFNPTTRVYKHQVSGCGFEGNKNEDTSSTNPFSEELGKKNNL